MVFGRKEPETGSEGPAEDNPTPPAPTTVPKVPLRRRVLPRTVLGISLMILSASIGAAFSGVVLYSYYQYRLDQTNSRVNTLIQNYGVQFKNAENALSAEANTAKNQIQSQLAPLSQLQAQAGTLAALVKKAAPSLFFVHTLDSTGQASVGTAFVISSTGTQSLLLTSYTTVVAATVSPGPPVYVQQGSDNTLVTVRTWDPQYDLALIVLPRGDLPVLNAAPTTEQPTVGEHVFALSAEGTAGASISQGAVTDASSSGIEHNTPISAAYQGGPLLDSDGNVVGVDSLSYAPLGFTPSGVWFAPYVNAACNKVLDCPGGDIGASS